MNRLLTFVCCLLFSAIYCQGALFAQNEDRERIYIAGFMEAGFAKIKLKEKENMTEPVLNVSENSTFVQSQLNLYFTFFVIDGWRAFCEIYYMYTPSNKYEKEANESAGTVTLTPVNNLFLTPTLNRNRYGSIQIERAFIEWNSYSFANLRIGRFFTPYGIWQRDHGSPIITSVRLPALVINTSGGVGMPNKQTGIELVGSTDIGNVMLEYFGYVTNGMTNADSLFDDDENKAVGGMLNLILPTLAGILDIEFGASAYYGKSTFIQEKTYLMDMGTSDITASTDPNNIIVTFDYDPSLDKYTTKQMDSMYLAHLKITIGSLPFGGVLVFQAEGLRQWSDRDDDLRIFDPVHGYPVQEDTYSYYDYYGQIEYQFYEKITPYFRYERTKIDSGIAQNNAWRSDSNLYMAGLNLKPNERVVIKLEYNLIDIGSEFGNQANLFDPTKKIKLNNDFHAFMGGISVAF